MKKTAEEVRSGANDALFENVGQQMETYPLAHRRVFMPVKEVTVFPFFASFNGSLYRISSRAI